MPSFHLNELAKQDLRSIGRHLIFYREASEGIEIIRILHERMDIESQFDYWKPLRNKLPLQNFPKPSKTSLSKPKKQVKPLLSYKMVYPLPSFPPFRKNHSQKPF